MAAELGIPLRLTQEILQTLQTARLISEMAGPEAAYMPARPLETINAHQVLLALRSANQTVVFTRQEPVRDEIYGEYARIEEAEQTAAAAVTLQALVRRARLALPDPSPADARPALPPSPPERVPAPAPTIEPSATAKVESAAPVRPPRKVVAPAEDHDFPL